MKTDYVQTLLYNNANITKSNIKAIAAKTAQTSTC